MNARLVLLAAALAAILLPASVAEAKTKLLPQQLGAVDLRSQANVTIVSAKPFDEAGRASANAGDVNGDGIDDVIVGAMGVDRPGRKNVGAAYLVFGRRTTAQVRRASLTARGFRILGTTTDGSLGVSVAPAGDVDGDGLDDVVVGSGGGTPGPGAPWRDGEAWIVKGKRDGRTVDLAAPGVTATKLVGPPTFGQLVAGGEDVDGDGRPDVAVAAARPQLAPGHAADEAGVFVVRGGPLGGTVDVRALGDRGITIRGIDAPPAGMLAALTLVRDMNGDGRAEVALGTHGSWTRDLGGWPLRPLPEPPPTETLARVIFGRPTPATVDVSGPLADDGFVVQTSAGGRHDVQALSGGGDVNGDGRGDLVLGDPAGHGAHVVFGGAITGVVDVADGGGFSIGMPGHVVGYNVALTGDVNGDGLDDVLAGDPAATIRGRIAAGRAYLVYGRRSPGAIDVGRLGSQGFALAGASRRDGIGAWLSSAGDFNGDGHADLLIGSSGSASTDGRSVAYIVYGFGSRR